MAIELGALSENSLDLKRLARIAGFLVLAVFVGLGARKALGGFVHRDPLKDPDFWANQCVQPGVLEPESHFINTSHFLTPEYRKHSAALLSGAVRVPTESFDDMAADPRDDSRFEVFEKLHSYLNASFPLVTASLELVNTYGLLYTIKGAHSGKPTVLMAHQDVVPVEPKTVSKWTHKPFSGHYDGERVWGRGALDTKSSLVATLEAVENLLGQDWVPHSDVLLAFGFDEELDGSRGAQTLADTIRSRYGEENSVFMIVDEGSGVAEEYGSTFAAPSVVEKGYTDLIITIHTPGGHSSQPPDHTSIGIASDLITKLENSHRNAAVLAPGDTIADEFACFATHGASISKKERATFVDVDKLDALLGNDRSSRALVRTTQAIDVIDGGVKINALPEQVRFIVNYRISVHETVADITKETENIARSIAARHNLGLVTNNHTVIEPAEYGYVEIENGQSLEPAPISPYSLESEAWKLLGGTTRHVLETYFDIERVFMTPALMGGNTDTVHYWGLTDNIYRYTVGLPETGANAHTVDEWIFLDSHLATVAWYYELLQFV